jgi:hypothetical protein
MNDIKKPIVKVMSYLILKALSDNTVLVPQKVRATTIGARWLQKQTSLSHDQSQLVWNRHALSHLGKTRLHPK